MERRRTCWHAAETGSGMTLGDTKRFKCGDVTVDGEAMSRGTTDVPERAEKLANTTRMGRSRIVQTFCDTTKSGAQIRLQMLEISLVSHSVPVRVISCRWDEIPSMSCRVSDTLDVWKHCDDAW